MSYTYDLDANITNIVKRNANAVIDETLGYSYDSLSRILTATINGQAFESYTYNTTIGTLATKTECVGNSCNAYNYTYDPVKKHQVTSFNGISYAYDANGSVSQRGGAALAYDPENHLTGYGTSAAFVYDGDGKRVKATVSGATTVYIGSYFEWTGSTTMMVKYYYAGAQRIAMRVGTGSGRSTGLTWLFTDHLGSTVKAVDAVTGVSQEMRYAPWGATRSGALPTTFRFTGQRAEPGLDGIYYYGARWYDAALGRFLAADTIIPDPYNPLDWDRYSYGRNNPIKYNDPTGHIPACDKDDWACQTHWDDPVIPSWEEIPDDKYLNGYFDEQGICVYGNCSGGLSYYKELWKNDIVPTLPKSMDQVLDIALNIADNYMLPALDGLQDYTGIKIPEGGRIGFGLDGIVQTAKDRDRNDLNSFQKAGRALLAGSEGYAVSDLSLKSATTVSTLAIGPAVDVAVKTGYLHAATAIIGGTWVGVYAGVNVGLSWGFDKINSFAYPLIGLGEY